MTRVADDSLLPATKDRIAVTSGRMLLLLTAFAATILLLIAGPPIAAAASPGIGCDCGAKVLDSQGKRLKVTPGKPVVLLIHGIFEGPDAWGTPDGWAQGQYDGSLFKTLEEKYGNDYTVGRFNYEADNDATDLIRFGQKNIADNLAVAIDCLARTSGLKVSLVGYSRGGLLAQEALGLMGSDAGNRVAGLVAIATPWHWTLAHSQDVFLPKIPTGIGVMPVAAKIHSGPRRLCPFKELSLSTASGDGCFEAAEESDPPVNKNQIIDPKTVECTDNRSAGPGLVAISAKNPIAPESKDPCSAYAHEHLPTNPDIVEPIVNRLDHWRNEKASFTSVEAASVIGGCDDVPTPVPTPERYPYPELNSEPMKCSDDEVRTNRHCEPKPSGGEQCQEGNGPSHHVVPTNGHCEPKPSGGEQCQEGNGPSHHVVPTNGHCEPKPSGGEQCQEGNGPSHHVVPTNGHCEPKPSGGEQCQIGDGPSNGACSGERPQQEATKCSHHAVRTNGHCESKPSGGKECQTGDGPSNGACSGDKPKHG